MRFDFAGLENGAELQGHSVLSMKSERCIPDLMEGDGCSFSARYRKVAGKIVNISVFIGAAGQKLHGARKPRELASLSRGMIAQLIMVLNDHFSGA